MNSFVVLMNVYIAVSRPITLHLNVKQKTVQLSPLAAGNIIILETNCISLVTRMCLFKNSKQTYSSGQLYTKFSLLQCHLLYTSAFWNASTRPMFLAS